MALGGDLRRDEQWLADYQAKCTRRSSKRAKADADGAAGTESFGEASSPAVSTRAGETPIDTPLVDAPASRGPVQATLLELRSLRFELPMPPSVNELYRQPDIKQIKRGLSPHAKWLTDEQKAFRKTVVHIVREAMRLQLPLAGRLSMRLTLAFANRRRTDISNRIKAVEDALTHAQAYHDDSQIDLITVERVLIDGDEACAVALCEIAA